MNAENLLALLKSNPEEAIKEIKLQTKDSNTISEYIKEYVEHDRTIRGTQIGTTQKDKTVGSKRVQNVRIPINFAKKIVTTSAAFEVGKPATIIPSEDNNLHKTVKKVWHINRLDAVIQKIVTLAKSETQSACQFYVKPVHESSLINKLLVKTGLKTQVKEIKAKVLKNVDGIMTPYFDEAGDMILFMWEYSTKEGGKDVNNIQIWDKTNCYTYNDLSGKMAFVNSLPHGFDRIPVVYVNQNFPEWFDVKEMIDRYETTLSRLSASNDYSAYPLLKTYGEIKSFPDKDDMGKVINFPIKVDSNTGKEYHGDASFLVSENAPESTKLELESLLSLIHYISQTPNISFDNIKGISNISGIALKLMFLDAMIKATMNEGKNRTMIERMLNIIISGIAMTTNTALKKEANVLYYDVEFNSILPDDLKEAVEIVSSAVSSGVMSKKTGVEYLNMNPDTEEELELIKNDKTQTNVQDS